MERDISNFICGLPKAELHVHLEGTLEPEFIFKLSERNKIALNWDSPDDLRKAYEFKDLSSFLDVYFKACEVIRTQEDFYDLTIAYLNRAIKQNIKHVELFLGPQSFMDRGIRIEEIICGTITAIKSLRNDISAYLLPSILRTRPAEDALQMLKQITPWIEDIRGVGMGGSELGYPSAPFTEYFKQCKKLGLRTTVHAGEETSAEYVKEVLKNVNPDRIAHGLKAAESRELMKELSTKRIPLTLCPLSNLKLKNIKCAEELPVRDFLKEGILLTINSDDPAYFLGYLNENYELCAETFKLGKYELCDLAKNSFTASFLPNEEKKKFISEIDSYFLGFKIV